MQSAPCMMPPPREKAPPSHLYEVSGIAAWLVLGVPCLHQAGQHRQQTALLQVIMQQPGGQGDGGQGGPFQGMAA